MTLLGSPESFSSPRVVCASSALIILFGVKNAHYMAPQSSQAWPFDLAWTRWVLEICSGHLDVFECQIAAVGIHEPCVLRSYFDDLPRPTLW